MNRLGQTTTLYQSDIVDLYNKQQVNPESMPYTDWHLPWTPIPVTAADGFLRHMGFRPYGAHAYKKDCWLFTPGKQLLQIYLKNKRPVFVSNKIKYIHQLQNFLTSIQ